MSAGAGLRWRLDMAARSLGESDEASALYFQADRAGFLAHLQAGKRTEWRRMQLKALLAAQPLDYRVKLARQILAEL